MGASRNNPVTFAGLGPHRPQPRHAAAKSIAVDEPP
uniref:Uncharacterized protein n=1 Tax=Arundo donax TaxID=35708 RepID=A0A0A8YZU8_ARUDO